MIFNPFKVRFLNPEDLILERDQYDADKFKYYQADDEFIKKSKIVKEYINDKIEENDTIQQGVNEKYPLIHGKLQINNIVMNIQLWS